MLQIVIPISDEVLEVSDKDLSNNMDWKEAIAACEKIGEGWRLPNIDEIEAVYTQLHKLGIGSFNDRIYWSSSEHGAKFAWGFYFGIGGNNGLSDKGIKNYVRAVRAANITSNK